MAIQYSKAAGFHTTGITRSKDIEEVANNGADSVANNGADSVANNGEILKQSDGGGADITLVTTNSYKVATEALGSKPRWKNGTDVFRQTCSDF